MGQLWPVSHSLPIPGINQRKNFKSSKSKMKGFKSPCLVGFYTDECLDQVITTPIFLVFPPHLKSVSMDVALPQSNYLNRIQSIIQLFSFTLLFVVHLRPLIEDSKTEVHLHRTKVILLIF